VLQQWWVVMRMNSRSGWPRQSHHGLMAPTHEQSCIAEREPINRNGMEKMGMHKAYLVHAGAWAIIAPPSLQSLHPPLVFVMVINTLEWYGDGGTRFRSPALPLPCSHSYALTASSPPTEMDHGKHPRAGSPKARGLLPCL
jgi:hypothetical protein